MRSLRAIAALMMLCAAAVATAQDVAMPTYDMLKALDGKLSSEPPQARVASLVAAFDAATGGIRMQRGCDKVASVEVEDMFRSTAYVSAYTSGRTWLDLADCLYRQLEAGSALRPVHHRTFHGLLVSMMEFERANAVRRRSGLDLPLLPSLRGSARTGRTVARVDSKGAVRRARLPMAEGWQLIAIVHPGCGYSRKATEAITTDGGFAWMRPLLTLVVPPGRHFPHSALQDWNVRHPGLPMQVMIPGPGWRDLDTLQTPMFHLLKDGELVETVVGWPDNGRNLETLRLRIDASLPEPPPIAASRAWPQAWFHP